MLNEPSDVAVDANADPVTHEPGSVYIADGYGNHRVVVFDRNGKFLRQWGDSGSGPGQFAADGGGHPHCVAIANDGLVYTCDRGNNRIQVFDKMGALKRLIQIDPPQFPKAAMHASDVAFSPDAEQRLLYMTDTGSAAIWIIDRAKGTMLGGPFGRAGHMAGEFSGLHTLAVDSKGNIYVGEGGGGRRAQKFVKSD